MTKFLDDDLDPLGRRIIACCLDGGTMADYEALIDAEPVVSADDD